MGVLWSVSHFQTPGLHHTQISSCVSAFPVKPDWRESTRTLKRANDLHRKRKSSPQPRCPSGDISRGESATWVEQQTSCDFPGYSEWVCPAP